MNRRTLLQLLGLTAISSLTGIGCDQSPSNSVVSTNQDPAMNTGSKATVKVKVFNSNGELVGPIEQPKVVKSDADWRKQLDQNTYQIARAKGTERSFCGNLYDNHLDGVYTCVCCKLPLFSSNSKFESGTGWPSFFQPISKENVYKHTDADGYREEILCTRCDCHLGHVFDDGAGTPTGLRFCVNSASMIFTKSDQLKSLADPVAG